MPLIDITDLVEATVYTRCRSQNGLMVWHYRVDSNEGTGASYQQAADSLDAAIATFMKDTINVAATYLGVSMQRISPAPKSDKFYGVAGAGIGNREDDLLVSQAAGLLSVRTDYSGRSRRGRKYFPFPSETDNDPNGKPTGDYLDRIEAVGSVMFNELLAGTLVNITHLIPVVYSRRLGLSYDVTRFYSRREWATQRRRSQLNRGDLPPTP